MILEKSGQKIGPHVTFVGNLLDDGKIDLAEIPVVQVGDDFEFEGQENEDQVEIAASTSKLPEVHVVIENKSYKIKTNSLADGIDVCFKVIKLLKYDYTKECKNIWSLIGRLVYKTKDAYNYAKVKDLMDEIDKITVEDIVEDVVEVEVEDMV